MSTDVEKVEAAGERAAASRQHLLSSIGATRARLTPARLKADAAKSAKTSLTTARREMIAHVRAHPVRIGFGIAALLAWIFRRPLIAHAPGLLQRGYGWAAGKLSFSEALAEGEAAQGDAIDLPPSDNDNQEAPHGD
ncbi:MAG: hypothetical protein IT553_05970 [Sphingomonadaceae bacterium]|nr:hypothetical protein [Sphingomonadaceae bacterium]